jgi:hypothetical protein
MGEMLMFVTVTTYIDKMRFSLALGVAAKTHFRQSFVEGFYFWVWIIAFTLSSVICKDFAIIEIGTPFS